MQHDATSGRRADMTSFEPGVGTQKLFYTGRLSSEV